MSKTKYYYSKYVSKANIQIYLDSNGNPIFMPNRNVSNVTRLPRVVVASVYFQDKDILAFGCSVCNPKDNFKKAEGRNIAYQRAISNPDIIVKITRRSKISKVSHKYAEQLIEDKFNKYV